MTAQEAYSLRQESWDLEYEIRQLQTRIDRYHKPIEIEDQGRLRAKLAELTPRLPEVWEVIGRAELGVLVTAAVDVWKSKVVEKSVRDGLTDSPDGLRGGYDYRKELAPPPPEEISELLVGWTAGSNHLSEEVAAEVHPRFPDLGPLPAVRYKVVRV